MPKEEISIDYNLGKIYRKKKDGSFKEIGNTRNGYLIFRLEGRCLSCHRFIYENYFNVKLLPNEEIDHINRIKDDNRIQNLRIVNRSQNNQNKPKHKNCSSKYKGVCWKKNRNKWQAQIQFDGKKKHLGYFDDEIEAVKIYNKYVKDNNMDFVFIPNFQKNI